MHVTDTIDVEHRPACRTGDRLSTAHRAFRAAGADEGRFDAAKHFSSQYLRRLSSVLPLDEITIILAAEQYREQGLALSRKGDHEAASELLLHARQMCDQSQLSRHAGLAALSFQLAAEAYVRHRQRDYAGAIRDLEGAIAAAAELETAHGHDMAFRRVHLARNILRVRASVPLDGDVVADTMALLLYLGGETKSWPAILGPGAGNPAGMIEAQKIWAMDELLTNLALPTIDLARNADLLPISEGWAHAPRDLRAAIQWCHALANIHRGTGRRFLDHAISFFETGSGQLIHAGQHLETLLEKQGFTLD